MNGRFNDTPSAVECQTYTHNMKHLFYFLCGDDCNNGDGSDDDGHIHDVDDDDVDDDDYYKNGYWEKENK